MITLSLIIGLLHVVVRDAYFLLRLLKVRPSTPAICRWYLAAMVAGAFLVWSMIGHRTPALAAGPVLFVITATALIVSIYDLRFLFLPDELIFSLGLCGVLLHLTSASGSLINSVIGGVLGGAMLGLVYLLYTRWRGVQGLGLGDVKLAVAIGLCVGPFGFPIVVAVGSLATLAAGLVPLLRHGRAMLSDRRLPFAPGLLAATVGYILIVAP